MHEQQEQPDSMFLTLTYDNENIPTTGSLVHQDFRDFMKRYRRNLEYRGYDHKIKYVMCGEYGQETDIYGNPTGGLGRPHYHACILGHSYLHTPELELVKCNQGNPLYTHPEMENLWGKGHISIGTLTFESAAYVARYIMKKVTGEDADSHYERTSPTTGEIVRLKSEYVVWSNGIGRTWYEKYKNDLRKDFLTLNGNKYKPPKYYDRCLKEEDLERFEVLKDKRKENARCRSFDNTPERLAVKEEITRRRVNELKRTL